MPKAMQQCLPLLTNTTLPSRGCNCLHILARPVTFGFGSACLGVANLEYRTIHESSHVRDVEGVSVFVGSCDGSATYATGSPQT